MATSLRLQEGGIVTLAVGPPVEGTEGPRLLRLETFGREHQVKVAPLYLHPHEVRELAVQLARRLPTIERRVLIAQIPIFDDGQPDPGPAGEEGGEPT